MALLPGLMRLFGASFWRVGEDFAEKSWQCFVLEVRAFCPAHSRWCCRFQGDRRGIDGEGEAEMGEDVFDGHGMFLPVDGQRRGSGVVGGFGLKREIG